MPPGMTPPPIHVDVGQVEGDMHAVGHGALPTIQRCCPGGSRDDNEMEVTDAGH